MLKKSDIPVVILAGGYGSRLSEKTNLLPKPMIEVGVKPILHHIVNIFMNQGFKKFYILGGYKYEIIVNYFRGWCGFSKRLEIYYSKKDNCFKQKEVIKDKHIYESKLEGVTISVIDTGLNTMTGGRLGRILSKLDKDIFILTYGDGLSNINLDKLLQTHENLKSKATISIVNPSSRYGRVQVNEDRVINFSEKPVFEDNWVNGGFIVFNKSSLKVEWFNDQTNLEKDVLTLIANNGDLGFYKHIGFWQCMDTLRDYNSLNKIALESKILPWEKLDE